MKLIKNLGSILLSEKHTKKATCGEYECPMCNRPTIHRISDVNAGRVKRCKACTIATRRTKNMSQSAFNMELIGEVIYRLPVESSTSGMQPYVNLKCNTCGDIREYQAVSASIAKHNECYRCRKSKKINDEKLECSVCKETKHISEFFKTKTSLTGYAYACKQCSNKSRNKYAAKVGKDFLNNKAMAKRYSLSIDEVVDLKSITTCGICNESLPTRKDKHIDHCHISGKVRGILCSKCNHGLGLFRDNVTYLQGAISWLKKNGQE